MRAEIDLVDFHTLRTTFLTSNIRNFCEHTLEIFFSRPASCEDFHWTVRRNCERMGGYMVIPRNGRRPGMVDAGAHATVGASAPVSAPASAPTHAPVCGIHLSRAEMMQVLEDMIGSRSMMDCAREWGVDFREIDKVRRGMQYPGAELCKVLGLEIGTRFWIRRQRRCLLIAD